MLDFRNELEDVQAAFEPYAFVSQIAPFTDRSLERDYLYARSLASRLPDRRPSGSISAARWNSRI